MQIKQNNKIDMYLIVSKLGFLLPNLGYPVLSCKKKAYVYEFGLHCIELGRLIVYGIYNSEHIFFQIPVFGFLDEIIIVLLLHLTSSKHWSVHFIVQ